MPVIVMHVGHMGMRVLEPAVFVTMRMRLPWRVLRTVPVPVMLVVHV